MVLAWRTSSMASSVELDPAPATTGNEMFERYFRVQMNTLEQLVVFIPSIFLFAHLVDARWAAGRALASHPRIAERATALGFGAVAIVPPSPAAVAAIVCEIGAG